MKTVQQLKEELETNGNLTELMDVLKGIAVSEYQALSKKLRRFEKFVDAFKIIISVEKMTFIVIISSKNP